MSSPLYNKPFRLFSNSFEAIKDFIFHPYCYGCEKRLKDNEHLICERCWNSVRHPAGGQIREPSHFKLTHTVYFKNAYILYVFSELSLQLIHLYKYKHKKSLGERIGNEIGQLLTSWDEFRKTDMLIPIPLHPVRLREREYNQSELLARYASEYCNVPLASHIITRIINNPTQTGLSQQERRENVKGIFRIENPDAVKDKNILLLDDVMTSGLTMNECAKTLKKAGASEVCCLAVIHPGTTS